MKMESDRHKGRGGYSASTILLAILIGFCILAIIEIIYGQAQIKMERERLALEESNRQAVQELRKEWGGLQEESGGSGEADGAMNIKESGGTVIETEKEPVDTEEKQAQQTLSENSGDPIDDGRDMQIVFMGDSILDGDRDQAGVASLVGGTCNARVYNLAVDGSMAALPPDEPAEYSMWDSRGLLGVVNAILGNIDPALFDGLKAGEAMKACDFSRTDYFVIEYGINDFLSGEIPRSKYLEDGEELAIRDISTYAGALDTAVNMLHSAFPDAKILIASPHFCQFFDGDTFVGDAYSVSYGYGNLVEFFRAAGYVAEQHKEDGVLFFNAMEESGIDAYTADRYLEDGVHLSEEGRRLYADCLSRQILTDFYPEE